MIEEPPGLYKKSPHMHWEALNRADAIATLKAWWKPWGTISPIDGNGDWTAKLEATRMQSAVFLSLGHGALRFSAPLTRRGGTHSRWLALEQLTTGVEHGQTTGIPYDGESHDVVLRDWSRHGEWVRPGTTSCRSLWLPAHTLPIHLFARGQPGRWAWPVQSPTGHLLAAALQAAETARTADAETQEQYLSAVRGLVAAVVPPVENEEEVERDDLPPVAGLMRDYLRSHLRDEDLGVTSLERAFQCSRSTVYRCFADVGGVRAFVQYERLLASRVMLRETKGEIDAPTFAVVAERCGFKEPAHFARAFRKAFGETPGTWLSRERAKSSQQSNAPEKQHQPPASIQMLHDWLELRSDAFAPIRS